jgi:hypothetical protein
LPLSGTYRILIRSFQDGGAGTYTLSLQPDTGSAPSLEDSRPVSFDEPLRDTLADRETSYYFDGAGGEHILIFVSSSEFDTYLELLNAQGEVIVENDDDSRTVNSMIDVVLPRTEIYFVIVSAYSLDAGGDFELELYRQGGSLSAGGAIVPGQKAAGRLLPETAAEWRFQGQADEVISASVMPRDPEDTLDLFLELLGPDGRVIASDDDQGFGLDPELVDLRLPVDGEYVLRVQEATSTIGGRYLLALAEGRAYFSPLGEPAHLVILQDNQAVVADALDDSERTINLWVVSVPEDQRLEVELLLAGDSASFLSDFELLVFDAGWIVLDDSANGTLSTASAPHPTDYLVLAQYRGAGVQPFQLVFRADSAAETGAPTPSPLPGPTATPVPLPRVELPPQPLAVLETNS